MAGEANLGAVGTGKIPVAFDLPALAEDASLAPRKPRGGVVGRSRHGFLQGHHRMVQVKDLRFLGGAETLVRYILLQFKGSYSLTTTYTALSI